MGPRFFVPKVFIPGAYDYRKKISNLPTDQKNDQCPICLIDLVEDPLHDSNEDLVPKKLKTCYHTPCKHNFHKACLKAWIDQNNECPICRSRLPPY